MKYFLKSKTIWAGLITSILPWLLELLSPETLEQLGVNPILISVIGVIFTLLRTFTTKPVTTNTDVLN